MTTNEFDAALGDVRDALEDEIDVLLRLSEHADGWEDTELSAIIMTLSAAYDRLGYLRSELKP